MLVTDLLIWLGMLTCFDAAVQDLSERFLRHRGVPLMPARTEAMVYYTPWLP